jgi:hypothetical protein
MTVATITRHVNRSVAAAAALVVAAVVSVGWHWLPRADGTGSPAAPAVYPEWFRPISRYYGNDPRITPQFDFASLYAAYPAWFAPIRAYYHDNPEVTPAFDFAGLYGAGDTQRMTP